MTKHKPITVIVPDEPPTLTPRAARALLRLLLDAGERGASEGPEEPGNQRREGD